MLKLFRATAFKKDFKKAEKQERPLDQLKEIILLLAQQKPLPKKLKDHALIGNYKGYRECHILPDWLLIDKCEGDTLFLVRLGLMQIYFKG